MRSTERSSAARERVLDDRGRGGRIEVRGRLVEHDDRRSPPGTFSRGRSDAVHRPRRPTPSSPTNVCHPSGRVCDPVPDLRAPQGRLDGRVVGARPREPHVLQDRRGEQVGVLSVERDPRSDVLMSQGPVGPRRRASPRPRSGSRKRTIRAATVLLPEPDGPTSAIVRPGSSRRSTSRSAHDASSPYAKPTLVERNGRIRRERRRFGGLEHGAGPRRRSPAAARPRERLAEFERGRRERNDALERAIARSATDATSTRSERPRAPSRGRRPPARRRRSAR